MFYACRYPKGNDSMSFLEGKSYRDHVSAKIIAKFDERTVSASQVDDNGNVNIYDIDYHFTLVDANKTINPITQNLIDNNNYEDWIRNVSEGDPVLCMGQVGTIMPNYTFNNSAFILQMYGDIQLLIVGVDTESLMEEDYVAIYGSYVGRDDSNRAIIEAERGLLR